MKKMKPDKAQMQQMSRFAVFQRESVDVEKIVETQMMIEAVRNAISKLNAEERDIIERLYFNDETLSSVARDKGVTYQTIQWRKDRILRKLKEILEKLL